MLNSGDLRSLITIVAPGTTRDPLGGTGTPTVFATVWARIAPASGSEVFRAQGYVSKMSHMIKIRYLPGLETNMSVQWDDRVFMIMYVQDPDERKFELDLMCLETQTSAGSVM